MKRLNYFLCILFLSFISLSFAQGSGGPPKTTEQLQQDAMGKAMEKVDKGQTNLSRESMDTEELLKAISDVGEHGWAVMEWCRMP